MCHRGNARRKPAGRCRKMLSRPAGFWHNRAWMILVALSIGSRGPHFRCCRAAPTPESREAANLAEPVPPERIA